jgi:hypothetical protein
MAAFFIAIFALSTFHFIYEGIIAPSLRLNLRFQIFELRDRLREMRLEAPQCEVEAYDVLHHRLNSALRILPVMNFWTLVEVRAEVERNKSFQAESERKSAKIKACHSPEIQDIDRKAILIMQESLVINTLGLAIYILPAVLAVTCLTTITKLIKEALLMPAAEIDRLIRMPPDTLAMQ